MGAGWSWEQGGLIGSRRVQREIGPDHCCRRIDVSRPEDCHQIISAAVEKFGRIDTVVCNAGFGFARAFDAMSGEDVRRIFDTNLFGTIECCRSAITIMKRQELRDGFRGQLMIVSSALRSGGCHISAFTPPPRQRRLSLSEGLRIELKPFGIAVTSVHPMLCETDFFSTANDLSGMNPAALAQGGKQSPQYVADRMARAIERPRRELWPKPMSRLSLHIAAMVPGIVDKVMGRIRDRMLRDHENRNKTVCADSEEESLSEIPA